MTITALRILPPFAIGRLGSAAEPLDNYTISENPEKPLDYRRIHGAPTLMVDDRTGEIREARVPTTITFKENDRIRPVAPFLEVFAVTSKGKLVPLTVELLREHGLTPEDVEWHATVANRKIVRRTSDAKDLVQADTGWFTGHEPVGLSGHCRNFVKATDAVDFGDVRYIRPNDDFPEIRLRFTPAQGLIYGPRKDPAAPPSAAPNCRDPIDPSRAIYDPDKGTWVGYTGDPAGRVTATGKNFVDQTLPPSLYAIDPPAPSWLYNNRAIARGYFDDACDGIVEVRLKIGERTLTAATRVCAGPPMMVPDSLFVRSLADDLDQVIHGPRVSRDEPDEVTRARAEDIVRRAYETVHFMNLVVLNGNPYDGRSALLLDSMPEEEAADTERAIRPIMSQASVDTLAALALHEQVFATIRAGATPWFMHLLRQPAQVADYTDWGRRKMPALMCGADNSYLALTYRQIDTIRKLAEGPANPVRANPCTDIVGEVATRIDPKEGLVPRNLSAQVHYAAAGNPVSSRPLTAVANCCPGLEVDFRAVWRRVFEGIVLREYDNLVVDIDPDVTDPRIRDLKGRRLLRVGKHDVMAEMRGPSTSDLEGAILLTTDKNPHGLTALEWSNRLAHVLHENSGKKVSCEFSKEVSWEIQQPRLLGGKKNFITRKMRVRPFFDGDTGVITRALAAPGELTQGLCSPWQNDYRECSCYYWASARPDFVNVEQAPNGLSQGDNWMQKARTGKYVADDYKDSRLLNYDNLFDNWEKALQVQVRGRDADDAAAVPRDLEADGSA